MRKSTLAFLVAATVLAAPARAQTPPPTPPAPPVEEPRIAEGVTVAGVKVGGMTGTEAREAVQAAFDRRLRFVFKTRRWQVRPQSLLASARVDGAVRQALAAAPGQAIALSVRVNLARVKRYVGYLDRTFSREPRDSRLFLRNLRPFLTKPRYGIDVRETRMTSLILRALRRTERAPIALRVNVIKPTVTRVNYGPVVVIRRGSRRLYLYRNMTFVRRFTIAVGMPAYPTPLGRWSVVVRERHPTWDPPNSPWAAGLGPVPPGPNNPLGTRWIGLSAPGIGIHGTPQPWTVGTAASHGCIRMYMREVEWLFERVRVGTTVFIVRA